MNLSLLFLFIASFSILILLSILVNDCPNSSPLYYSWSGSKQHAYTVAEFNKEMDNWTDRSLLYAGIPIAYELIYNWGLKY